MHKFTRGNPPVDFSNLRKKYNADYEQFVRQDKAEHVAIGDALYESQEHYCAYCETIIAKKEDGHIEHLERRSDNPGRTFDWSNLFFSCCHHDSCGKYKDETKPRIVFNSADIVDPSSEDPLDFFCFDMAGNISPKDGLSEAQKRRALETIRIFNLQESTRLKSIRIGIANVIQAFIELEPSEKDIDDFLSSIKGKNCISVYYSLLKRRKHDHFQTKR